MLSKASVYDPDDLSKKALYAQFNPNTLEYSAGANRYADKRVRDTGSTGDVEQQLASLFDPAQFPKTGGATDLFSPEA